MGAIRITTIVLLTWIYFVSAQYDNRPMTFQPIPVVLQLPERDQHNPSNLRYSIINDGNIEDDRHSNVGVNSYSAPHPHRRNDDSHEMPNVHIRFPEEKSRNNNMRDRYENSIDLRRPSRTSRGWQTRYSEQRPSRRVSNIRQSRKDSYGQGVNPHTFREVNVVGEVRRSPRIIKYIADENGFAVREDLVKPLQESLSRSRQQRILTAAGSSPQMSQVVTSAIKVTNGQTSMGGKYVPQITDLKIG